MSKGSPRSVRDILPEVLASLRVVSGPDARGEHVCWCPFHADGQGKSPHNPNLYVSERGFYCHACGAGGSLKQLAEHQGVAVERSSSGQVVTYDYCDEAGTTLYQVCRFAGKRFAQRRPAEDGGWIWNLRDARRVLYRLPHLLANAEATVYIVEGEKDVDRLVSAGLVATTNSGGAGKWRGEYGETLRDRDIVILPDNDEPGRRHARQVARSLDGLARSVKVVELSDLPEKGDVSDWLESGRSVEDLKVVVDGASLWRQPEVSHAGERKKAEGREKPQSQADRLVSLVIDGGVELFHDKLGGSFARIPVDSHHEIWRCGCREFRRWLAGKFWKIEGKAPGADALNAAMNVIESEAQFAGEEYRLSNRVARNEGAIWYDLTDGGWRAVEVTAGGWEVVAEPPILFRRYSHQKQQMEPAVGGNLRDLLRFVNLSDPSQEVLLLVYVVCCFVPDIAHPVPVVHGPQGSAKTTLLRVLRRLIDPSVIDVLSFPRDATELVQQLSHHWAPYYDNISGLPGWLSDILCRAVTGEGFSKRELYSDDSDRIYQFRRCIGLNGVNVVANKADLLDRCILFQLDPIGPAQRRSEVEIWKELEEVLPGILGGILDTLSRAMGLYESVRLSELPRMADFALWGCAVAMALGYSPDEFLSAYAKNTEARNEEALQASPVASTLTELMVGRTEWEGRPSELLAELEECAEGLHVNIRAKSWPKAAHALTRRLNEVRPNLEALGITVTHSRSGRRRIVTVRKAAADDAAKASTTISDDAAVNVRDLPSSIALSEDAPQIAYDGSDGNDGHRDTVYPASWPDELREEYDERVAIMVEDGGLPLRAAQEHARRQIEDTYGL